MKDIKEYMNIIKENSIDVTEEIWEFVNNLTPEEVGREVFEGGWIVNYEGFTDDCIPDAESRCNLPPNDIRYLANFSDVYNEVFQEWDSKEGIEPIEQGFVGDDDYPVLYAIYFKG